MRIARRTALASALAAIAAPTVLRLARADAPTMLKLHHFMSSVSSGHDKFLVPWARKIEAESGGKLRIDLFPSMQIGGAPAGLFDQARDGSLEQVDRQVLERDVLGRRQLGRRSPEQERLLRLPELTFLGVRGDRRAGHPSPIDLSIYLGGTT